MTVYHQIVQEGLAAQRKADHAEMARLLASGVDDEEAFRRVYMAWKSPAEYQAWLAECDAALTVADNGAKPCS